MRRRQGIRTSSQTTWMHAAKGTATRAPIGPSSAPPASTAMITVSGSMSSCRPSTAGEMRYPLRFSISTEATTVSSSVTPPSSAATANSGMRAIHGPTCGISSPNATTTASSSG